MGGNRKIEELELKPKKDICKKLSKSKLLTFETCPKKYWFSQYYPELNKPSPAMARGIEIHDILDQTFELNDLPNNKTELFNEIMKLPNAIKYKDEIKKFIEWHEEMNYITPESCEEKLYDEQTDIVVKWDRIDYDGNNRCLIDYKTGQKKTVENHKFELLLYAFIFMKVKKLRVDYVAIYFVDHKHFDMLKVTKKDIQEMLVKLYDYKDNMRDMQNQGVWPGKKNWTCKWCPFKEHCSVYNNYK